MGEVKGFHDRGAGRQRSSEGLKAPMIGELAAKGGLRGLRLP